MPVTPTGRGAQIVLDPIGDYAKAARGAYATTLEANLLKRRSDVAAGLIADGYTPDGRTNTGGAAADFLVTSRLYAAATTGSVSLTGVTTETNLAALRIPAGSIGPNGVAEVKALWTCTNNANVKSVILRFAPAVTLSGGVTGASLPLTSFGSAQTLLMIRNNNAQNAQVFYPPVPSTPFGTNPNPIATLAIDTTVDTRVSLNATLSVGTDTITLVHAYLTVFYA